MGSVEEKLRTFIDENILYTSDGYPYTDETSFLDNGIVDSTSILELVAFIEEQYDISIEDSEVVPKNFDSISSLSKYVRSKTRTI
jgi:acyl carrier protein